MPGSIHLSDRRVLIGREAPPHAAAALTSPNGIYDLRELGFLTPEIPRIDKTNVAKPVYGPEDAEWDDAAGVMGFTLATPILQRPAGVGRWPSVADILQLAPVIEDLTTNTAKAVYSAKTPLDGAGNMDADAASSATVELYEAGKKYSMIGARSGFKIDGQIGKELMLSANPKAPYAVPTASITPPTIAKPAESAMKFSGAMAITDTGSPIDIGAFTLDYAVDMQPVVSSAGVKMMPMDYTPIITIDPLAVVGVDAWARLLAATKAHFIATFAGGKLVIDAPAGQLIKSSGSDRNKRVGNAQQWELTGATPFTLTFS